MFQLLYSLSATFCFSYSYYLNITGSKYEYRVCDAFQTIGQMSTPRAVNLPQLSIGNYETQAAAQRAQPVTGNGVTLPRLSDHRRPARRCAVAGALQATRKAGKKDCLTEQDKENNERNVTLDDVQMPLSPNGM